MLWPRILLSLSANWPIKDRRFVPGHRSNIITHCFRKICSCRHVRVTFARQGIPMTWDFAEVNFFSESVGSLDACAIAIYAAPLDYLPVRVPPGVSRQSDAAEAADIPLQP